MVVIPFLMHAALDPTLSLEFIEKLPKVDLHVHLDGSLRLSTILDLATEQGVELPLPTPRACAPQCASANRAGRSSST